MPRPPRVAHASSQRLHERLLEGGADGIHRRRVVDLPALGVVDVEAVEGLVDLGRDACEIDQAFDSFYVNDAEGRKIDDPPAMDAVRTALEQALVQPL